MRDAFIVAHGDGARLMEADLSNHHGTVQPRKLAEINGTIESCRTSGQCALQILWTDKVVFA